MFKKKIVWGCFLFCLPAILIIGSVFFTIMLISGGSMTKSDHCIPSSMENPADGTTVPRSVEEFVKSHKDAYILSWKAGGFLPSASIAQTMVENGFNFTNPSGTSFWQAHNMGGVKTSRKEDFPLTLATFGQDAVDITGTKPGTSVGDNTGGAYTWFRDYNAGIVGKAEFMAHQSLYTAAINNTDGLGTLSAIYQGGWATDPTYLVKLHAAYNKLGKQFLWLDQEAIKKHGATPYQKEQELPTHSVPNSTGVNDKKTKIKGKNKGNCVLIADSAGKAVGETSAPTLEVPAEYKGKLTLPPPDQKNYEGNSYPFGECTWGTFNRMAQIGQPIEWFSGDSGNGGNWGASARAKGYTVVRGKPAVGWAASFYGGLAGSVAPYGHIAVCEYVNPDGSILVSETNVVNSGSGTRSWRVLDKATVDQIEFIQGKGR